MLPQSLTGPARLEHCVVHILKSEGVAPFGEHASELIARTSDPESSPTQLLRAVLKDLGLTSLILRVANSALYNRSSRPIQSVAHAIVLLGRETVRNLVSALHYIEHYASHSPGLRELMLLSVLTAAQAREVAAAVDYPRPDEAYVMGLLRNLGEVLIAFHYPHEYSQVILLMYEEKLPERIACKRVLGFHWDELGQRIAKAWMVPRIPSGTEATDSLTSIVGVSQSLTNAIYRRAQNLESLQLPALVDVRGRPVRFRGQQLRQIVDNALRETQHAFAALRISLDRLQLEQQARSAQTVLKSACVFSPEGLSQLQLALENLARSLQLREVELGELIAGVLDALECSGFERAIFALVNEDGTAMRGRLAGAAAETALPRFQFRLERAGQPILASLVRKVDVLVDCERDDRYNHSELVLALQPGTFALFPIVLESKLIGCLYADRSGSTPDVESIRPLMAKARCLITSAVAARA